MSFLPISIIDMQKEKIEQLDFILVTGDAYVDHPSFAHAIISRYLVAHGYSVGIISRPKFKDVQSFKVLGEPRLAFLVSSGNMDSMVNIFTASKNRRNSDMFAPNGKMGGRPERAVNVYCNKLKEAYPKVPIIIGGIEASLRRFAHYDYWENKILPSILITSKADILVYGMGERAIVQVAEGLDGGINACDITYVEGTVYKTPDLERVYDYKKIYSLEEIKGSREVYQKAFLKQMYDKKHILVQKNDDFYIVQNVASQSLSTKELDFVYSLPYEREAHPIYKEKIPAFEEVKFSITATRGCIGGCSFCSLFFHQGKNLAFRSEHSILDEAQLLINKKDFKGYIHDVGGPTANFYGAKCRNKSGMCEKNRCLTPTKCKYLEVDHSRYVKLLRKLRELKDVKKVFIRSGIRYDYIMYDKNNDFITELIKEHVSGQLKVAPEHVSYDVLNLMGKPDIEIYDRFCQKFEAISSKFNKKQYVLPYFMSSHPGSTIEDAIKLAEYMRDTGFSPEQVQDFYPTPGTLATCMFYTKIDPSTNKTIYVAKKNEEKAAQRALIQYKNPKYKGIIKKTLIKAQREDLIGKGKKALIKE